MAGSEPVEKEATPAVFQQVFEVTHSITIGALVAALAKAQLKFKPVLKQNENAAFTRGNRISYYADLAAYIDATQEALAKEELVVLQWPDVSPDAKTMTIESILAHSSGEWMRGRLTLPALGRDGFTAQSCGSSITYGRRYSYAAITGCASQDDDGNAASGRGSTEAAQDVARTKLEEKAKSPNPKVKKLAEDGLAELDATKPVLSLFYVWHDESQTAEITGAESLKTLNKDILRPLWSSNARCLIANAEQLEFLKLRLEERGVPFTLLKAASGA
jgi:hypothetical protein